MMISNLPLELQNKIFYYYAEHPITAMLKNEIKVIENIKNRRLYWKATDECFHTTYLSEDGMISFILEDNIKTKNIGRLSLSKNVYDDYNDTEDEDLSP